MDISKLTAMAGMPSSMSEALKQSIDFQRHLSDAMKPAFGFDHKFEELSKLANSSALLASQFGAASQFAKEMEEQSRHLKTLTEPLSLFRGSMLFSDQVTKAMASSLERHNAARELAVSFSTAASALRMSDEISKQMMGISSLHLERFAEITKPYQGLLDSMNFDSYAAKTARDMASHHFWEKQYQLPVIDSAAASTIAAIWGRDGIEKQLKSFGVDFHANDIEEVKEKKIKQGAKIEASLDEW